MPPLRGLITTALLVIMEVVASFTIVMGSGLFSGPPLGDALFWLLVPVALAGAVVSLVVSGGPWSGRAPRIITIGVGVVLMLALALPLAAHPFSALLTAILVGAIYYRGAAAAGEPPTHQQVMRRFGLGLGLMAIGILWITARGIIYQAEVWHLIALLGISYVVLAMVALVLSRVEATREPGAAAAVALAVALQLGFLLLLGLAAVLLFAHDIGGYLLALTAPFWHLIGFLLKEFILALVTPLFWALNLVRTHTHAISQVTRPARHIVHCVEPFQPNPHHYPVCPPNKRLHAPKPNQLPLLIAGSITLVLIFIGLGVLVWKTLPHLPRLTPERGFREERRFLSPAEIWALLRAWVRSLLRRGTDLAASTAAGARRRIFGLDYPQDPVRQVYARLLRRAAAAGLVRDSTLTPSEFQYQLTARWPAGAEAFAVLTDAYILRRYGEIPFAEEQLRLLRAQWGQARALMRRETANPAAVPVARPVSPPLREKESLWRVVTIKTLGTVSVAVVLLLGITGAMLLYLLVVIFLQHR